jgi:hypothetical protein
MIAARADGYRRDRLKRLVERRLRAEALPFHE